MFDLIGDVFKLAGKVVGTVTGTVIGLPLLVVSETLGITAEMVKEAVNAGCETYEEIKDFFDLD